MNKREYNEIMFAATQDLKLLPNTYLNYLRRLFAKLEKCPTMINEDVLKVLLAAVNKRVGAELLNRKMKCA